MSTLAERLSTAAAQLTPVTETPQFDAELLLAHALGWSRSQLLVRLNEDVHVPDFDRYIMRRLAHEPIAYILESWEFYGLEFTIRPPLLVPRPETEHLVEVALNHIGGGKTTVLDLCTGTGCVACAIATQAPASHLVATDVSPAAVALARENLDRHRLTDRMFVYQGDLYTALPASDGAFDVIVSNPPYVEDAAWNTLSPVIRMHEDPRALLAGPDGLDAIWGIITSSPRFIRPGGLLALEVGDKQAARVMEMAKARGYAEVTATKDLAGIDRIVSGVWPS